jgi:hypothetical protein
MVTNGNTIKPIRSKAKEVRQHMTSLCKQEAAMNRPIYIFFHSEGRVIYSLESVTIIQHIRRDSKVESEGSPLSAPTRKRLRRAAETKPLKY